MTTASPASEAHLAAAVARRHYLAGVSKIEIGREFGISRFKVARLLELARELELVRIEVRDPSHLSDPLADQLKRRLGILSCVVVRGSAPVDRARDVDRAREHRSATAGDAGGTARQVGVAGARVLEQTLTSHDVLGLPWATVVHHAVAALTELPPIPLVQLCGSLILPGRDTPYDLVRRAAALTGAEASYYHAPLVMPTAAGAEAIRGQEDVAAALAAVSRVTIALCSIGAWQHGGSTVYQALPQADREAAAEAGVIGETMGVLFDAQGRPAAPELATRLIGISAAQLAEIPTVVAMSRGADRAPATQAACVGGFVHHLIIDEAQALALLDLDH